MQPTLVLAPFPRTLIYTGGYYSLKQRDCIVVEEQFLQDLSFSAHRFLRALQSGFGWNWEILPKESCSAEQGGLFLQIRHLDGIKEQGYSLSITPKDISIRAGSPPGIFYGVCTLVQLVDQYGGMLPCLQIDDWPDFPARGVMLDISRDKVPTMEALFSLIDLLASWKINQVQFYTEHTFAYSRHEEVWANASPITGAEIEELDRYCRERFIELVPNQNSFGHMRRWLTHNGYAHLAEIHGPFETPWGIEEGPFSLCPVDPGSLELVSGLYDELLPFFSSRMVNVGCDETFDLGAGRSKEACDRLGTGRVYLDYLLSIYQDLKERGSTMQFWGDILLHYPDLIPQIPRDVILLDWGYEADYPFEANSALLSSTNIPFYVCPGTSSWCSIAGRTDNALGNLSNAARSGIENGAAGYLITDWGDNGHWQVIPVSYLGFLAGAAYAWGFEANRELDIPAALDLFAFRDRAGVMGKAACDLGNIYRAVGLTPINSSVLFTILQRPLPVLESREYLYPVSFDCVLEAIEEAALPLSMARMDRSDRDLLSREFHLTARMLRHACHRGILAVKNAVPDRQYNVLGKTRGELDQDMQDLIQEYRQVWLARNRLGGMADSIARLEKARLDYQG